MSKAQFTDIILLAFISGVVAILTSMMGISGTIIGAVVTSLIAESLKAYLKEPLKERINELDYEKEYSSRPSEKIYYNKKNQHYYEDEDNYSIKHSYYPRPKHITKRNQEYESFLSAKILFIFPLMVIFIIELIHFLGAIGIIPYDIFYSLETITNWKLLRTIGYALIIMGIYPLISKKFSTSNGIILIVVGVIELIFGYADVNVGAQIFVSLISSLREFINIGIILTILYIILTIHEETPVKKNRHNF